jgi:hypothetical protein
MPFFAAALVGPIVYCTLALYAFRISIAARPVFRDAPGPTG